MAATEAVVAWAFSLAGKVARQAEAAPVAEAMAPVGTEMQGASVEKRGEN